MSCFRLKSFPKLCSKAYLENNLGVANVYSGQLNEGAIRIARSAQLEPGVAAFAHNVVLLREMAVACHQQPTCHCFLCRERSEGDLL